MEITIHTSDPDSVAAEEIARAIESLGYYVGSVTIEGG